MKVLIVDDHIVIREGVRRLLASFLEAEVFDAGTIHEAQELFRATKPDIVILDLNLPGVGGLGLLWWLLVEEPRTRILVLSVHTTPIYVMRAMQAGARGYVSKGATAAELMEAIRQIIDGARYVERDLAADLAANGLVQGYPFRDLSNRELDILRLLAQGKSMSDISASLSISYKTVANICTSLKQKLMVERIGDLIRIAVEMHST
jgi:DNA-binding NarL/FixJ family response regulator